jgi:hypothetical protein
MYLPFTEPHRKKLYAWQAMCVLKKFINKDTF